MRTVVRPEPLRVALVGCGAVAKSQHLPILAGHDGMALSALVDRSESRARELAQAYSVPCVLTDIDALDRSDVDAVVLATPPAHHSPAVLSLAARGLHVFVEKPMAITTSDAEAMVAAADRAGVTLGVGFYRRMLPAVRLMRTMLESSEYGAPLDVDIEEGGAYGWQLATLDVLTPSGGGGGVLIDIGSHLIDLLLFLLPGDASTERYLDNARGGIETDCVAQFQVTCGRRQIPVRLELSRTRQLRGSIRVRCEHATLELLRGNFTQILVHKHSNGTGDSPAFRLVAERAGQPPFTGYDAFRAQIDDWLQAIAEGSEPQISGRSVVPVVRLIEECYSRRESMIEPWTDESFAASRPRLRSSKPPRVLVTGAGGFLGCRTVELLRERYGYEPVALIREPKSAARLARWPTEIILGDVCSREDMDRAMRGCDAVIHCAVGTSWDPVQTRKVTVDGTRTAAEAALRARVRRFVHISTMAVHRPTETGVLDERVPLQPLPQDAYGCSKLKAEDAVRRVARRGLSTVILRPARIYGPFSKTFTIRPLQALSEGRLVIAGNPQVPANMVYVDNVVAAMACALEAPNGLSDPDYLVNDPDQLSLVDFFKYFASPSGPSIRVVPPRTQVAAHGSWLRRWLAGSQAVVLSPELRALVHRVMDTDPMGALPRWLWNYSPAAQRRLLRLFRVDAAVVYRPAPPHAAGDLQYYGDDSVVSSNKAQRELGFSPIVSRERAMALTLQWAQEARLLETRCASAVVV